jgi:hypothetical protein
MKFTPKTDDQFEKEEKERKEKFLWPAGTVVDYQIISAETKVSSGKKTAGEEMLELAIEIYNDKGDKQTIREWIGSWNLFMLKAICESNGMLDAYEAGDVNAFDLYDKTGKVILKIEKGQPNPNGGNYPDKNKIDKFLKEAPSKAIPTKVTQAQTERELDDEIPF